MPRLIYSNSLLQVLDIVELLVWTINGVEWPVLSSDNYWPKRPAENVNRELSGGVAEKCEKVQGSGLPRTPDLEPRIYSRGRCY